MSSLSPLDQLAVEAFATALDTCREEGVELPNEVWTLAQSLEHHAADLSKIAEQHPQLHNAYQEAYKLLRREEGERHKRMDTLNQIRQERFQLLSELSINPPGFPGEKAVAQASEEEQSPLPLTPTHLEPTIPETSNSGTTSSETTNDAVGNPQFLDTAQTQILKALDKYTLSVTELAPTIHHPPAVTHSLVQTLWAKGYIDYLGVSPLYILLPTLRDRRYRQKNVASDRFLTLTAKGYFHLHPLFKRPEATILA